VTERVHASGAVRSAGELVAEGIGKVFAGGERALDGVSFTARPGRVLTLLGPSGCGKSTLLRIVAGLEVPTAGRLTLDGQPLDGVPPGERDVGFVFQNYALYPHLSVARNLSLGLEARGLPRAQIDARIGETARMLGIADLLGRRPGRLSGGQQQRVALGRALARRPRLYLMDEPLSNLDALLRETMRAELRSLFRRLAATVLYVTHDQAEAMSLSDEILLLRDGRALQRAAPLEIYERPADLFTASFVGSPRLTVWRGRAESGYFVGRGTRIELPGPLAAGRKLDLGVRPEHVAVSAQPLPGAWPARLEVIEPLGDRALLTLRVGEETLRALAPHRAWPDTVFAYVDPARFLWFDGDTGRRLEGETPDGSVPAARGG
jgi:ABC-type sugar transport system ATPase subunit